MTPKTLVAERIKTEWQEKKQLWKLVYDWTVVLYIVLPGLVIGGFLYYDNLFDPVSWMHAIPPAILAFFIFFAILPGQLRYYYREADQLFLHQQTDWMRSIRRFGLNISLFRDSVRIALVFLLALPFFIGAYKFNLVELLLLYVLTVLLKQSLRIAERRTFELFRQPLRSILCYGVLIIVIFSYMTLFQFITSHTVMISLVGLLLFHVYATLRRERITRSSHFSLHVAKENEARYMALDQVMRIGGQTDPKPLFERKRPWILFRRSQFIFRSEGASKRLAEVSIKRFLRTPHQRRLYIGMTMLPANAMLLLPGGPRIAITIGVSLMVLFMVRSCIADSLEHRYLYQFRWDELDAFKSKKRSTFILLIPFAMIFYGYLGASFFGLLGILPFSLGALFALFAFTR
ncbi:ABC transporter permease [Geomicrobium sediminis]|uniref:ABC-2 type transport system permease protein n=1 Tax=Geomicrobium sediminis TaxID=1347788 RepID=A0ABS2PCS5_9BACL|nr:ABC transporter permease [Geomicrobium sediminis]MBM7633245.1 ABC-2 type transport system permease protein [Geomicrobium sediminis]